MEHINSFHLFTRTYELNGLSDNVTDTEGSTATGITIELCEHHAIEIEAIVEFLGCIDSILTCHRVNHKECFIRVDSLLECGDLVHHILIDSQTAGSIDDDHIIAFAFCLIDSMLCNLHGILAAFLGVDRHLHLLAQRLQLADSGRTIHVARDEHHALPLLGFQVVGQLGAEGGLTRTLQTGNKHHRGLPLDIDVHSRRTHEFGKLLVHNLHHQLAGLNALDDVATHGLGLHLVGEFFGYRIAHISVQQGLAHLLDSLRHIDIGYRPLATKGM